MYRKEAERDLLLALTELNTIVLQRKRWGLAVFFLIINANCLDFISSSCLTNFHRSASAPRHTECPWTMTTTAATSPFFFQVRVGENYQIRPRSEGSVAPVLSRLRGDKKHGLCWFKWIQHRRESTDEPKRMWWARIDAGVFSETPAVNPGSWFGVTRPSSSSSSRITFPPDVIRLLPGESSGGRRLEKVEIFNLKSLVALFVIFLIWFRAVRESFTTDGRELKLDSSELGKLKTYLNAGWSR